MYVKKWDTTPQLVLHPIPSDLITLGQNLQYLNGKTHSVKMLLLRSDGREFIPKASEMGLGEQRELCVCSGEKLLIKAFDSKIYILC